MITLLKNYVDLIKNDLIKNDVIHFLQIPEVQLAFSKGSTHAGKFHPDDENIANGLLLHTLRVCNVGLQMLRSYYECDTKMSENFDILIASAILHDVPYKFKSNGFTNLTHAHDNAIFFSKNTTLTGYLKDKITTNILCHMGRWGNQNSDIEKANLDEVGWILHLADNIASRKNIKVDIDCIDYLKSNLGG